MDTHPRFVIETVESITDQREFTYVTAITHLKGERKSWEQHEVFLNNIKNPIKLLTFSDILDEIYPKLNTTVASSEVGRVLQLIKASGWVKNA